ncbi:MAG: exodeoxyribonuclease VII small subunit [Marinagarivorans sp.]|nr:exodeoxyribonuclease VII small subunit [Marinagarivorans sp.]
MSVESSALPSDKKTTVARKKAPDFEKSLAALEAVVDEMEGGELSLDAALKAFERGVKLTQECQQALTEAEQKVAILLSNNPNDEPQPFEANDL